MRNMKSIKLFVSLLLFVIFQASAQLSDAQYQKIDSLFLDWNKPNHPGGVIGVVQNGKTVFSKAYGLASLEYLVPNSQSTKFNIASVSKQFTAMGIVVLQQRGKLSVDDDIRKHLPELPDFGETVTIRHMLHHTSGLRSLHAMLGLAGWRGDDSRTNEDLDRFMLTQKDLNFKPGDEYLYCNTGFMLMVNIIEKISGEKFSQWMETNVFKPLGMINTYVEDNYSRVVRNNATSYNMGKDNEFDRAVEYWGYVGSGNMHSTTDDLLRWLENFSNPKAGWESHFKIMQTLDNFNDGRKNSYAFGVGIGDYNGVKSVGHGGAIGGFRSNVITYPEKELSIVILTNFSSSSPSKKSRGISEIILGIEKDEKKIATTVKSKKLSNKVLAKYEGQYWNNESNYSRKVYLRNDTLRYFRSENNENPLIPIGKNKFKMSGVSSNTIINFDPGDKKSSMSLVIDDGKPITSEAYLPTESTKEELSTYAGEFYSPELETTYIISLKDATLSCHHSRHGDFELKRIKKDVLEGRWPFNIAKFERDNSGNIKGILVSNGRVRNLWLEKK